MLKTNKDKLIQTAVQAVIQPTGGRGYGTSWDGTARMSLGTATINYTVSIGDPTWGYANDDHVEPDVTVQGRDKPSASDCAIAILACIGNEARVVSGDAKGAKGMYIGRHAGADDLVWFPKEVLDDLEELWKKKKTMVITKQDKTDYLKIKKKHLQKANKR